MCRFVAYLGSAVPLERIVVLPAHSLLEQSQNATEAKLAVNGDGFGMAWYAGQKTPGLYRDVLPAWADSNLLDLCRVIEAPLFFAHVRASTVGQTSRANCHPFRHKNWVFMHNGQIGGFQGIKRTLETALSDDLYHAQLGSTDSELLFLTLLQNGLADDPIGAVQRSIAQIQALQGASAGPNRLTCAMSDGETIYAFRYSTDTKSPTLYIGKDQVTGGALLASEPLDASNASWCAVDEMAFVEISAAGTQFRELSL